MSSYEANNQNYGNSKRIIQALELKGTFCIQDQEKQMMKRDYQIIIDKARYEVTDNQIDYQQCLTSFRNKGNSNDITQELELKGTLQTIDQDTQQLILTDYQIIIDKARYEGNYQRIDSYLDFVKFIEEQYNLIKTTSSNERYEKKIIFQFFVYICNIMELIFTLMYGWINNIQEYEIYAGFYYFSILLNILIHIFVQFYTNEYMNAKQNHLFQNLLNYCYYTIFGIFSYIKLLPFLMFYTRDTSIRQFSFNQINKYLKQSMEYKQENSSRLFKKRNKKVNIFRDLIFHNTALISMMITFLAQSIPMLLIQGLFNIQFDRWNEFNIMNYILLIVNSLYYVSEYQYIVIINAVGPQYLNKDNILNFIAIKNLQGTKQLLKAEESYYLNFENFLFQIDASKLNEYEKKMCIIQIIRIILRFKNLNKIIITNIDSYEPKTLKYLANAFEFIKINQITLIYENGDRVKELQNTFNFDNCYISQDRAYDFKSLFSSPQIYNQFHNKTVQVKTKRTSQIDAKKGVNKNRKISKFFYLMTPNQLRQQIYYSDTLNRQLASGGQEQRENLQRLFNQKDSLEQIKQQNEDIINDINKFEILKEQLGCFRILACCYEQCTSLKQNYRIFQTTCKWVNLIIEGLLFETFFIIKLIYFIQVDKDSLIWALIILEILNPIIQTTLLYIFIEQKLNFCFFLGLIIDQIFQFTYFYILALKTKDPSCFDLNVQMKFKSYTAKFKGMIGILAFEYPKDEQHDEDPTKDPIYQGMKWRSSVNQVLYRIPQVFIYILVKSKDYSWGFSFVGALIDVIFGVKNLLALIVRDYFVPALILRKISFDQFLQSFNYLNPNQEQILIEYPKSFAILSKLDKNDLNKRKYKIDFTQLDYSYFKPKRKQKLQAQMKLALVNIKQSIEIEKAQDFLYLGEEVISILKCLQVSDLQQLKLNFQLDKIEPENLYLLNVILSYCPNLLNDLAIHVETKKVINLKFNVEREYFLTSFRYSYYLMEEMAGQNRVSSFDSIQIDEQFLQLDRYDFKQFYFKVGGRITLYNCQTFFNQFTEVQNLEIILKSDYYDQSFSLQENINSSKLTNLSLNLKNINFHTQGFSLMNLNEFKLTLRDCQFDKKDLSRLLFTMKSNGSIILNLKQKHNYREHHILESQEMLNIQKQLQNKNVTINFLF